MSEYQFANKYGEIIIENYENPTRLSPIQILQYLKDAFQLFPFKTEVRRVEDQEDVFCVAYSDNHRFNDIYICGKGTTPGGRSALKNEQRIQPQAQFLNYVCEKKDAGHVAVVLGVYTRDNQVIFCTWKVTRSTAAPETPISKQIKIDTIAAAIREGFSQQERGSGTYVCAFKPEFLYFYLRNCEWIHDRPESEVTAHHYETEPQNSGLNIDVPKNRIIFGAPGTGKSFMLNKGRLRLLGQRNENNYERVTFHPDYSYANFVGTYKPVPCKDSDNNDAITYEYVPGPFMRIYAKALANSLSENVWPYLLIIEEINRANVAAVFGDIFQLLDRNDEGTSEYPVQASEDMKKYLSRELDLPEERFERIAIPSNMFIWATMNSADQGVFPMDTAFKRRWDFTYLGIDDNEKDLIGKTVVLGSIKRQRVEWNKLRKAINHFLASQNINEDKQLGPYFIARSIVIPEEGNEINRDKFIETFKNKVLMYLFEDAAKQKQSKLFEGCFNSSRRFSEICREFDEKGIGIFNAEIQHLAEPEDLPDGDTDGTTQEV